MENYLNYTKLSSSTLPANLGGGGGSVQSRIVYSKRHHLFRSYKNTIYIYFYIKLSLKTSL